MSVHTPNRKASAAVWFAAIMFATAGPARADVFNITFTGWFAANASANSSRTFTGIASKTPESLNGFGNGVICSAGEGASCLPQEDDDPAVDMSTGDPFPQIHFTIGTPFSFTITPNVIAFDLINDGSDTAEERVARRP